jgi:hypothetical protein
MHSTEGEDSSEHGGGHKGDHQQPFFPVRVHVFQVTRQILPHLLMQGTGVGRQRLETGLRIVKRYERLHH